MTKNHAILIIPFFTALLGTVFCVWSALGNDVNFCVTTGCTLYQDFSIAGVSMWWVGTVAFALLAICALLGQKMAGKSLAALFLLGDTGFLTLMAFTAPCLSCLTAAAFFAICFWLFRRNAAQPARSGEQLLLRPSPLLWIWFLLFIINIGVVVRSEVGVWPLLDESGDASTRMFFSVDCPYCKEGIDALAGKVDVAFYPVLENPDDVYRIARMMKLLEEGMAMDEALSLSADYQTPTGVAAYAPEMILLRFRLLRNKAHIFAAGSQSVPFFEQKGMPVGLVANKSSSGQESGRKTASDGFGDFHLPDELTTTGQCGGGAPCPPTSGITIN